MTKALSSSRPEPRGVTRRELLRLLGGTMGSLAAYGPSAVTATAATATKAGWKPDGAITLGLPLQDWFDLNPLTSSDTKIPDNSLIEPLVFFDKRTLAPTADHALAESWRISPDGTIYTFNLKKNVLWHDGVPMTAEDVKFTVEAAQRPETGFSLKKAWDTIKKVEVLDANTVRMTLSGPDAGFLYNFVASGIVPKHVLDGQDLKTTKFRSMPVGTGCYTIVEHSPDWIRFLAFDRYYGDPPHIKELRFKDTPTAAGGAKLHPALLLSGEIDVGRVGDVKDYASVMKTGNFTMLEGPSFSVGGFYFNTKSPQYDLLFKNKLVRQALYYGLDTPSILKTAWTAGKANYSWFQDWHWAHSSSLKKYPYDPGKAKSMLQAVGWQKDGSGMLRNAQGKQFKFTLAPFAAPGRDYFDAVVVAQQGWKALGIETDMRTTPDWPSWLALMNTGDWDVTHMAFHMGLDPSVQFDNMFRSGRGIYGFRYDNPTVDRLLDQGKTETDLAKRKEIYGKAQEILADDLPMLFVMAGVSRMVVRKNIKGVWLNPTGAYAFWPWYLEK